MQGFRDKITSTENRIKDTRDNLDRVRDIIREVSRQVASLKRQATKAKNRDELKANILELDIAVFRSRLAKAEQDWSGIETEEQALQQELSGTENNYRAAQSADQALREMINAIDNEVTDFRRKIDQKQSELARYLEAETKRINQISQTKAFLESAAKPTAGTLSQTGTGCKAL